MLCFWHLVNLFNFLLVAFCSFGKSKTFVCSFYMTAKRQALQMNYVITCSARISKKKQNASTNNWLSTSTTEANYKAFMWSRALEAMQDLKSMECHGWMKNRELLVPQPITKALAQVNLLSDSEESCEKSTFEEELLNSWHMRHPYLRG